MLDKYHILSCLNYYLYQIRFLFGYLHIQHRQHPDMKSTLFLLLEDSNLLALAGVVRTRPDFEKTNNRSIGRMFQCLFQCQFQNLCLCWCLVFPLEYSQRFPTLLDWLLHQSCLDLL